MLQDILVIRNEVAKESTPKNDFWENNRSVTIVTLCNPFYMSEESTSSPND